MCLGDGLGGAEHVGRGQAALEQPTRAAGGNNRCLGRNGLEALLGAVIEYGASYSAACTLNKVDKLMAGE